MWAYIQSEPGLYTVGFYAPDGEWHADSDWSNRDEARARVHYLNGGMPPGVEPLVGREGYLVEGEDGN